VNRNMVGQAEPDENEIMDRSPWAMTKYTSDFIAVGLSWATLVCGKLLHIGTKNASNLRARKDRRC